MPARLQRVRSLLLCAFLAAPVAAHDPGLSALRLERVGDHWVGAATFAPADFTRLVPAAAAGTAGGQVDDATLAAAAPAVRALAARWQLAGSDGGPAPAALQGAHVLANRDVELTLAWSAGGAAPVTLHCAFLDALTRQHRHYVAVDGGGTAREALLTAAAPDLLLPAPAASDAATAQGAATTGTLQFVGIGIEHILTGFDHVCFLLGLLVVARSVRGLLATITAFTVAHSLTLLAAGSGWLLLPSRFVEPAIAASIVFVAVQNLRGRAGDARVRVAFGFGLVHGFGFAAVLEELQIGRHGVLAPLLGFNGGVEIGQLAIAAAVLPACAWLRRRGHGPALQRSVSLAIAAAGAFWFAQRVLGGS